jgi:threonylcarbamoyladenosine tRNA methylthiotransferase MtaB
LNFSETSTIGRLFENAGYAKVDFEECPDVFIINTCSVTENADKKCKQLVKRAKKINPDSFIAIIGCYAQLKPTEIAKIPGVNMVLGANEKFNVLEHIERESTANNGIYIDNQNIKKTKDFIPSYSFGDRTRSFLKIQDGCDYFCTFCTIPLARGVSRNAGIAKTITEAKKIAETSVNEIVLTGVNIGDFGQGSEENFLSLIKEMDNIVGIERFRISSIEPNLLSNDIIEFCLRDAKKFTPHFHIPLQSGSDRLLIAMRRKYMKATYTEKVQKIKQLRPDACIGVDVIVGFPGETDADFDETFNYLSDLDISYLHVFTYSERANTSAVKIGEVVPMEIRRIRSKKLQQLSQRKKNNFYAQQIGSIRLVLVEQEDDDGFMYGFTENYIKVKLPYNKQLTNTFQAVELLKLDANGIMLCNLVQEVVYMN